MHTNHMRQLASKLSKQIRKYLSVKASHTYYYGFIHSLLSYGLLVWGAQYPRVPWACASVIYMTK